MDRQIPITLEQRLQIEVDGERVARGLGLAVARFRELMDQGRISVLCERGTGEHAGLYRASFYHDGRRVRLVLDRNGEVVQDADASVAGPAAPGGGAPRGAD